MKQIKMPWYLGSTATIGHFELTHPFLFALILFMEISFGFPHEWPSVLGGALSISCFAVWVALVIWSDKHIRKSVCGDLEEIW